MGDALDVYQALYYAGLLGKTTAHLYQHTSLTNQSLDEGTIKGEIDFTWLFDTAKYPIGFDYRDSGEVHIGSDDYMKNFKNMYKFD